MEHLERARPSRGAIGEPSGGRPAERGAGGPHRRDPRNAQGVVGAVARPAVDVVAQHQRPVRGRVRHHALRFPTLRHVDRSAIRQRHRRNRKTGSGAPRAMLGYAIMSHVTFKKMVSRMGSARTQHGANLLAGNATARCRCCSSRAARTGRWVIPKGWPEGGRETAAPRLTAKPPRRPGVEGEGAAGLAWGSFS